MCHGSGHRHAHTTTSHAVFHCCNSADSTRVHKHAWNSQRAPAENLCGEMTACSMRCSLIAIDSMRARWVALQLRRAVNEYAHINLHALPMLWASKHALCKAAHAQVSI